MSSIQINGLEYQIERLLRTLEQLKNENSELRQKLTQQQRQIEHHRNKDFASAQKIKKIVAHLREYLS